MILDLLNEEGHVSLCQPARIDETLLEGKDINQHRTTTSKSSVSVEVRPRQSTTW
jgi:hypothetical protein